MLRKRKGGPKKATVPLSQKAAQLKAEEGSLLDDSAKAALARIHAETGESRASRSVELASRSAAPATDSAPSARSTSASAPEAVASETAGGGGSEGAIAHGGDNSEAVGAVASGLAQNAFEPDGASATQPAAKETSASDATVGASASDADSSESEEENASAEVPSSESETSAQPASGAADDEREAPATEEQDGAGAESADTAHNAGASRRPAVKKEKSRRRRAVFWTAVGVLVVLLAFFAYSSWDRWLRYDDASSIQSQWVVEGGTGTVTIDGESIHLTDADAYSYEMDTFAKTLVFSFGDLSGSARYRFSADHTRLALQDGEYGPVGNFFDDLGWGLANLGSMLIGQGQLSPTFGEGSIVLVRSDSALQDQVQEPVEGDAPSQTQQEQPAVDQAPVDDGGQDASAEPEVAEEQPPAEEQPEESIAEIGKSSGEPGANAVRLEDLL